MAANAFGVKGLLCINDLQIEGTRDYAAPFMDGLDGFKDKR